MSAPDKQTALANVRRTAGRLSSTRTQLETAIRDASRAGLSLRAIADAAEVSHEQIRRIVAEKGR